MAYKGRKTKVETGYTLSWSKQKFPDFYPGWYESKFDNRHKLNLSVRHRLNDRIDVYGAWTYRSGDRATVPTQYANGPSLPGVPDSDEPIYYYGKPNNISLPAYHRLDVGINFRNYTRKGFERICNSRRISIGNNQTDTETRKPIYATIPNPVYGSRCHPQPVCRQGGTETDVLE